MESWITPVQSRRVYAVLNRKLKWVDLLLERGGDKQMMWIDHLSHNPKFPHSFWWDKYEAQIAQTEQQVLRLMRRLGFPLTVLDVLPDKVNTADTNSTQNHPRLQVGIVNYMEEVDMAPEIVLFIQNGKAIEMLSNLYLADTGISPLRRFCWKHYDLGNVWVRPHAFGMGAPAYRTSLPRLERTMMEFGFDPTIVSLAFNKDVT
jgi:hypothetical protein